MKIIFNIFLSRTHGPVWRGCVMPLSLLLGCLEPHSVPEKEQADAVIPIKSASFSYKDVRDIFDRQNCTVCHNDEKKLDLRRFPFRRAGEPLSQEQQILESIWRQLTGRHEPDEGILPIKRGDLERLELWRSQGFAADGPSPVNGISSGSDKGVSGPRDTAVH